MRRTTRRTQEHRGTQGRQRPYSTPNETKNNEDKDGTRTRRKCRNRLLKAIQTAGKVLDPIQKESLSRENLFTEENAQQAIDALTCETAPGIGGWPALFYKAIGKRIDQMGDAKKGEATKKNQPSALATILAKVFITMAEKKELIPEMVDSTVSLIYKDKG